MQKHGYFDANNLKIKDVSMPESQDHTYHDHLDLFVGAINDVTSRLIAKFAVNRHLIEKDSAVPLQRRDVRSCALQEP